MGREYVLYVRVEQYGLAMDANKTPKTKQELNWNELRMSIRTQRLIKKRYEKGFLSRIIIFNSEGSFGSVCEYAPTTQHHQPETEN